MQLLVAISQSALHLTSNESSSPNSYPYVDGNSIITLHSDTCLDVEFRIIIKKRGEQKPASFKIGKTIRS